MENKEYTEIAPGVWSMKIVFVNVYMVRTAEQEWVLVDAGLQGSAEKIIAMAESLFGEDLPPAAIILTHGHFDHRGALPELLKKWPVEVFAHPLELPYLTGLSAYPPADPTTGGGLMSTLSFLYPKKPVDLGTAVHPLKKDGSVPYMPGWCFIHTPGHAPGHISLFREADRVLLAGDAFVTTVQESLRAVINQTRKISGPPKYFTPNWTAAALSVKKLMDLKPEVAGTGHGQAMRGEELSNGLKALVADFKQVAVPRQGRYVNQSAKTDRKGVRYLPPAPFHTALAISLVAVSALVTFSVLRSLYRK